MIISRFRDALDPRPELIDTDWSGFCRDVIGRHHQLAIGEKIRCPAFSPAAYPVGVARGKANVIAVSLAVFDYDGISDTRLSEILTLVAGTRHLLYTSYSHVPGPVWRVRLVFDLDEPVPAAEWPAVWSVLAARLSAIDPRGDSVLDLTCKDASRIYFLPYTPAPEYGVITVADGHPLCVAEILADAVPAAPPPVENSRSEAVTKEELKAYAAPLARKADPKKATVGRWLLKVAQAEPWAVGGSRHNTMLEITAALERAFPLAPIEMLADLFTGSLVMMQGVTDPPDYVPRTIAEIGVAMRGARQNRINGEAKRRAMADGAQAADIEAALGDGRRTPYTPEELETFAAQIGVTVPDLRKHWIIQRGPAYYVLVGGAYQRPVMASDLLGSVRRDLAPAITAGVNPRRVEPNGVWVRKTREDLMEDYGTVARDAVASYLVPCSRYDARTQTFFEAAAPARALTPDFSHVVDAWLQLLGGAESYGDLCRWLKFMWDLSQPLVGLYIEGVPGAGKSLFAEGVARAWGTQGATPAEAAVAHFNGALLANPIVAADDHIPKIWAKDSGQLREFISARNREIERKYLPRLTLEGCIRLIITSNNQDLIRSAEILTENDRAGILARLYHVKADRDAVAYLRALGAARVAEFVRGDEIARHAAWLRDNLEDERQDRFGIVAPVRELHETMKYSQPINAAVAQWLVGYLLRPEAYINAHKGAAATQRYIRVLGNILHINVNAFCAQSDWDLYASSAKGVPTVYHIGRALTEFAPNRKHVDGIQYRVVDTETLIAFGRETQMATAEQLQNALAKLSAAGHRDEKIEVN